MSEYDPDTNDKSIPTKKELAALIGVSRPAGDAQVNSVIAPLVSCKKLYVEDGIALKGAFTTEVQFNRQLFIPDGTAMNPAIAYTSDIHTGIYKKAPGSIGMSAGGVEQISVGPTSVSYSVPITTTGGQNLVVNPSGPSVDFSGKTLINVGGIVFNPNYYTLIDELITNSAVPATLVNIPTITDAGYTLRAIVTCSTGSSMGNFNLTARGKNASGVVTTSIPYLNNDTAVDGPLTGISVQFGVSGTNIILQVTGIAAVVKWTGVVEVVRVEF